MIYYKDNCIIFISSVNMDDDYFILRGSIALPKELRKSDDGVVKEINEVYTTWSTSFMDVIERIFMEYDINGQEYYIEAITTDGLITDFGRSMDQILDYNEQRIVFVVLRKDVKENLPCYSDFEVSTEKWNI